MNLKKVYILFVIFFCLLTSPVRTLAQESAVRIELGESPLPINQSFTITVVITNSEERSYDRFPDLSGFTKRGTSSSTINDKTGITQRITQRYVAARAGSFLVPPFSMVVNGQLTKSSGGIIAVTAEEALPTADESGADLETGEEETTVADSKSDAFLSLRANRNRVFVGEGFTVRLSFYLANDSRQELQSYLLNEQIAQILPKIRPDNCWEENSGISGEPQTRPAVINGRRYTEYRVFEAAYFPLNTQEIRFPEVSLNLLTHPAGSASAATLKPFRSQIFVVQPRPLPPHPLRDRVAVGVFHLQESLSPSRGQTGRSLSYTLRLTGEGNLAGVELPVPANDDAFDFYPPDVQQAVSRQAGRVRGEKVFNYQLIPKRAGTFALRRYVRFIFFNPQTARFDTLRPQTIVRVTGKNVTTSEKATGSENALYARLDQLDSTVVNNDNQLLIKHIANVLLAVMLAGMVVIFWRIKE